MTALTFSLMMIVGGTTHHTAEFTELASCQQQAQRLRIEVPQATVACVPVNRMDAAQVAEQLGTMRLIIRDIMHRGL